MQRDELCALNHKLQHTHKTSCLAVFAWRSTLCCTEARSRATQSLSMAGPWSIAERTPQTTTLDGASGPRRFVAGALDWPLVRQSKFDLLFDHCRKNCVGPASGRTLLIPNIKQTFLKAMSASTSRTAMPCRCQRVHACAKLDAM